jgi:hypothetical protein
MVVRWPWVVKRSSGTAGWVGKGKLGRADWCGLPVVVRRPVGVERLIGLSVLLVTPMIPPWLAATWV